MINKARKIQQLPLYLLSLIVSLAILANTLSHWYTQNNPLLAIWFNPLRTEPRLQKVQMDVENLKTDADTGHLLDILESGIAYEPYDARLYGLLGLIKELNGSTIADTQPLYQHALALNKTELRSLLRSFAYEVNAGEIKQAMEKAELIFRAWSKHWTSIEQYIPALLSTPEGYEFARERFSSLPNGSYGMLNSLTRTDGGLNIARRLLLDWQREGIPDLRPAINLIINRLISKKRYYDAYLLHGLTLNKTERAEVGLVFNSEFNLDPSGDPFDWRLPKLAGVGSNITKRPVGVSNNGTTQFERTLQLQFLNTPVRLSQRLQFMRLSRTKLNWTVSYSTRELKGPNPIKLAIRCYGSSTTLQTIALPAGNPADGNKIKTITSELELPRENCEIQEIIILNDNRVESWQNRYSGSLFLHSVKIEAEG